MGSGSSDVGDCFGHGHTEEKKEIKYLTQDDIQFVKGLKHDAEEDKGVRKARLKAEKAARKMKKKGEKREGLFTKLKKKIPNYKTVLACFICLSIIGLFSLYVTLPWARDSAWKLEDRDDKYIVYEFDGGYSMDVPPILSSSPDKTSLNDVLSTESNVIIRIKGLGDGCDCDTVITFYYEENGVSYCS